MTSNVGQNYPYTSETEAERATKVAAAVAGKDGLGDTIAGAATPIDPAQLDNDRWWVWKCPTQGCPGLLHVAGYAMDKHALFVVCDTCARTFLR